MQEKLKEICDWTTAIMYFSIDPFLQMKCSLQLTYILHWWRMFLLHYFCNDGILWWWSLVVRSHFYKKSILCKNLQQLLIQKWLRTDYLSHLWICEIVVMMGFCVVIMLNFLLVFSSCAFKKPFFLHSSILLLLLGCWVFR